MGYKAVKALPFYLFPVWLRSWTWRGIALAVVIFGRWSALGVVGAAIFFGAATALQFRLQAQGTGIPYPVFLMFPYVITLAVLAFAAGRTRAPAELGRPYEREAT